MTVIETQRLHIRPWRLVDRPALARMAGDEEMMRYVTQGRAWTDQAIDEMLERQQRHLARHGVCFGAAVLKTTEAIVGLVGLQQLDNGEFEIGWWIWKEHWGQGLATEAGGAFVDHARDAMGLQSLVAVIDPPNAASKTVAEKLGMRYECTKSARETVSRREDQPVDIFRIRFETGTDRSDAVNPTAATG